MIKSLLFHTGRYFIMLASTVRRPSNIRMYWKEIVRQMYDIGVGSVTIVVLISVFIGAVSAVQFSYQIGGSFIPKYYIGYIVRDMTIIELAPTFTGLVLAGKVGSNVASEIGGMRQKEHIDAMEVMGVNTASYLILPKLIAAVLIIPILVCIGAFVSIVGGYIAAVPFGDLSNLDYIKGLRSFFEPFNVVMMLVKALVFAFILTSVSCYQGFYVEGGSIELGKASTNAVVISDVMILLADYIIVLMMTQ